MASVVYVVLASSAADSPSGKGLKSGVYSNLESISPFIVPEGSPLPLIIQCHEEKVSDLRVLAEALRRVGGGDKVEGAERFVKGVIEQVGTTSIWPDDPPFYALLRSSAVRKFIAPDYGSVVDYTNGTGRYTLYKFPSFIGAFVYTLAGGNTRLKRWGLPEWQGVPWPKDSAPQPSFSIGLGTPSRGIAVPPPPPTKRLPFLTSKDKKEGDSRGKERVESHSADQDSVFIVPGNVGVGQHIPLRRSKSRSSLPSTSRASHRAQGSERDIQGAFESLSVDSAHQTPAWFRLPSHLVSPSFLSDPSLKSNPMRFMRHRPEDDKYHIFTLTTASAVSAKNGPIVQDPDLPPMAFLYLCSHGWRESAISSVRRAYLTGSTLADFLTDMGRQHGMPLTEASFLWSIIQYSGRRGS